MKIVHVVTYVSEDGAYGGPLAVAISQAGELARLGHEVEILAGWDGKARLEVPGVKVRLFRARGIGPLGFSGLLAPGLTRHIGRVQGSIDMLHVHLGRDAVALTTTLLARRLGISYVIQTHGMVMPDRRVKTLVVDRLATRSVVKNAAVVLTLTEVEDAGIRALGFGSTHFQRIPNGIAATNERRPSSLRSNEEPEVLFLARLHPRKRVMAFAEMARILRMRGVKARFTVIGPDEGSLNELSAFIESHADVGLTYQGALPQGAAASRIAKADVYVLPSIGEVFPMTVLEALSVATPTVITTDCGIAHDLSTFEAALVSNQTPRDLADAVERILQEPELRLNLAKGMERALVERFDIAGVAADLERTYRRAGAPTRRRLGVKDSRADLPKAVWVTNTAAPYRLPVWDALSSKVELDVWLLENDERLSSDDNNRGDDWKSPGESKAFNIRQLDTWVVRRGEARYYFAKPFRLPRLRDADVVLIGGWDSPTYWLLSARAKAFGIRRVGFYESHALSQRHASGVIAAIRRRFLRSLDGVVVPGVAARDTLIRDGIPADQITMGFNAVDVVGIHAAAQLQRRKNAGSNSAATPRLLYVGQLIERKNISTIIASLAMPGLTDAVLTVVGTGDCEAELRDQASHQGVEDRVVFAGLVDSAELPKVFSTNDVLILISTEEVWGLVINEALAAGLRVVIGEKVGAAASVRDMPGVAITSTDVASVAQAINEAIMLKPRVIDDPEILKFTPSAFADAFLEAWKLG